MLKWLLATYLECQTPAWEASKLSQLGGFASRNLNPQWTESCKEKDKRTEMCTVNRYLRSRACHCQSTSQLLAVSHTQPHARPLQVGGWALYVNPVRAALINTADKWSKTEKCIRMWEGRAEGMVLCIRMREGLLKENGDRWRNAEEWTNGRKKRETETAKRGGAGRWCESQMLTRLFYWVR